MRFFVFEYDTFYIGIATLNKCSDGCIEYCKEIHAIFLSSKPFYVFFLDHIALFTYQNARIFELEVIGEFSRTSIPSSIPPTYHRFKFDPNDDSCAIEAQLGRKTSPKTKQDMEAIFRKLDVHRCFVGMDVYTTKIN